MSERINGTHQHKNLNGCFSGTPKQEQFVGWGIGTPKGFIIDSVVAHKWKLFVWCTPQQGDFSLAAYTQ